MGDRKVPLYQNPRSFTTVEEGATKGAIVGKDLRWPDGSVVTQEQLRQAATAAELDVVGLMSIQVVPVGNNQYGLQLRGDIESPGNSYYYGTDAAGTKGWHALPDPVAVLPLVTGEVPPVLVYADDGSLIYAPASY